MLPAKASVGSIVKATIQGKERAAVVLRAYDDGSYFVIGVTRSEPERVEHVRIEPDPDSLDVESLELHAVTYFTKGLAAKVKTVNLWHGRKCTPALLQQLHELLGFTARK